MTLLVARKDVDTCTGHDACPPRKAVEGSPDVFLDGYAVVRLGDKWEAHGCPVHPPHAGHVAQASSEVTVNGLPVVRVGDPLDCGGVVQTGAAVLYAGGALTAQKEAPKPIEEKKPTKDNPAPSGKSRAASLNDQLKGLNPGRAGDWNNLAAANRAKAEKYQELARQIGERNNLPPAMVLAWMNRESSFGDYLRSDGYSKFDGQGYGVFQVDKNSHTPTGGPFSQAHTDQAMGIYKDFLGGVQRQHPDWTPGEQMAGALVEYNSGNGNARTRPSDPASWARLDDGTASKVDPKGDYSRDIVGEAQWYADNLKW